MKHWLLVYTVVDDYVARRAEFRDAHLTLAWAAHGRGELLLGGAVGDPVDGAILLFAGDTPAAAEAFAAADPYVLNHLVTAWRVTPWHTVAGDAPANAVFPPTPSTDDELRAVGRGLADADAGRVTEGETVFQRLRQRCDG